MSWAWDISLVVDGLPKEARTAFMQELTRVRKLDEHEPVEGRRETIALLRDSIGQRAAMMDQFKSMMANATVELVEEPRA